MDLTLVAHCHLNPEVRVRDFPGKKLDFRGNVIQLPCPELIYFGPLRWEVSREQLDFPMYRRFCHELIQPFADLLELHRDQEIIIVGVSKSPSCAAKITTVGYKGGKIKEAVHEHRSGMGIFFEELHKELKKRGINAMFRDE